MEFVVEGVEFFSAGVGDHDAACQVLHDLALEDHDEEKHVVTIAGLQLFTSLAGAKDWMT